MARDKRAVGPDLGAVELLRWSWRQLTSMRTALVLLFMVALAAVPGSVIPQQDVDAFAVSQWREDHPELAPWYDRLGLFDVFGSVWFSAIYLLLVVSLVGCFVPRTKVYWKALRADPPKAPANLLRFPDSSSYTTAASPDEVVAAARGVLRKRRFRVVSDGEAVSGERGYLREAGNLLFHLAVLVVLAGFAMGQLWGYKGGVIVTEGYGFSNGLTQYDDFVPGTFTQPEDLEPFTFTVDDFDVTWLRSGPRRGMGTDFHAQLTYREGPDAEEKTYDLRVNHPLSIGDSEVFLIGHGYAPVITVRDGNGDIAQSGPTPFLIEDQLTFTSTGVVKAPSAQPEQIGLEGYFYPTYILAEGDPMSVFADDQNPTISMEAYVGDLGLDEGASQSIYRIDKSRMRKLEHEDGSMFRADLQLCPPAPTTCRSNTVALPDGMGTVTFEGVQPWVRVQISKTPGKMVALGGVIMALVGLCASLYVRPRRMWVRARRTDDGGTVVEVAALDRSSIGEAGDELAAVVAALQGGPDGPDQDGQEEKA